MKKIVLCADDYGLNQAINRGILMLVKVGRLSATSVLINFPEADTSAKALLSYRDRIDIGLHLNFTQGLPLTEGVSFKQSNGTFHTINQAIISATLKKHLQKEIEGECRAQLALFESLYGFLPDFIDGHQHVHHLPGIRTVLLKLYHEYFKQRPFYFRSVYPAKPMKLKGVILALTGASAFKKHLIKDHIPHNTTFSGLYDFNPYTAYSRLWAQFLTQIENQGLIMCHPAQGTSDTRDPIAVARLAEYQFLLSPSFTTLLEAQQVKIGRFYSKD